MGPLGILLVALAVPKASAESRPEWTRRPPASDAQYKYFLGRHQSEEGEASAMNGATLDAQKAAIRDCFGVQLAVQGQSYETETESSRVQRAEELYPDVELQGLEAIDSHTESAGPVTSAWVLMRYSRQAIELEVHRLKREPRSRGSKRRVLVSEIGDNGEGEEGNFGSIEVETRPRNATIYIDDERWGTTPLKIRGKITAGRHSLHLEHPDHEDVEEKLILLKGQNLRIFKSMKRAKGSVRITSDPEGARIMINGVSYGKTPSKPLEFPAGTQLRIELTHPDTERTVQELEVTRSAAREIEIPLRIKTASLGLRISPREAQVRINEIYHGALKGPRPTWFELRPGRVRVEVWAPDHESQIVELNLRAGDRKAHRLIALKKSSGRSLASVSHGVGRSYDGSVSSMANSGKSFSELLGLSDRQHINDWVYSLSFGYHDSTASGSPEYFSAGGSLEKKILGLIGIRVTFLFDFGESGYKETNSTYTYWGGSSSTSYKEKLSGTSIFLTLPVYLTHASDRAFSIGPEFGQISHSVSRDCILSCASAGISDTSISQSVAGVAGTYQRWYEDGKWGLSVGLALHDISGAGTSGQSSVSLSLGVLWK